MYPRNAASPPRIAIGAVVQISDGAVQSSGVSVVVRPEGGAESAGGGTIAYSAASNVVYYTPTQAETNYSAFAVIAYKTGCIPVEKTVVTTESAIAGRTSLGMINGDTQSVIDAKDFFDTGYDPATHLISDPAGVTTLLSRLSASRAGYLDNLNNSNLANVPAFPSNFASLGINASGHISRVTLADTTTTNTDMITAAGIRAAVGLASANLDTQLGAIDDYLDTELAAVLAAVDTEIAAIVTAVGTALPAQISALMTTAMTESYRADGATATPAQAMYEIMALLGEFEITSTTKQHKKIDGSSNAFASTLNSSTAPTAITRSLSA